MEPRDSALTELLDEILHVQTQGVEGGGPALIVLLVDRDGGQAATHCPLLKHVDLHPGAEMLLKEMGHGGAPDSSPDHGCQQARRQTEYECETAGHSFAASLARDSQALAQAYQMQKGNLQTRF